MLYDDPFINPPMTRNGHSGGLTGVANRVGTIQPNLTTRPEGSPGGGGYHPRGMVPRVLPTYNYNEWDLERVLAEFKGGKAPAGWSWNEWYNAHPGQRPEGYWKPGMQPSGFGPGPSSGPGNDPTSRPPGPPGLPPSRNPATIEPWAAGGATGGIVSLAGNPPGSVPNGTPPPPAGNTNNGGLPGGTNAATTNNTGINMVQPDSLQANTQMRGLNGLSRQMGNQQGFRNRSPRGYIGY